MSGAFERAPMPITSEQMCSVMLGFVLHATGIKKKKIDHYTRKQNKLSRLCNAVASRSICAQQKKRKTSMMEKEGRDMERCVCRLCKH